MLNSIRVIHVLRGCTTPGEIAVKIHHDVIIRPAEKGFRKIPTNQGITR
jgi:hypothetical protein